MAHRLRFASLGLSHAVPHAVLALSLLAPVAGATGCARGGDAPAAETAPGPDFPIGARVEVQRFQKWFPATVLKSAPGAWLIHYEGFGKEWDEQVGVQRIRAVMPSFPVGEHVLVQMANRVALADVVAQTDPTHWKVHYDGYAATVGEVVGPDRLRRPYSGTVKHPVGEPVGVELTGHVFSGKIIALSSADRVLVRFGAFGPDYDQEVGIDKLRAVPAEVAPTAAAPAHVPPPSPPTPPITVAAGPKPAGAALVIGQAVFVSQRVGWIPATIHGASAHGWKVHYDGVASGDEDVAADRVFPAPQPVKGSRYSPNQHVFVEWHGVFFAAKVLKEQEKGLYKLRYEGQGPAADEILPAARLRPRP